MRECRWREPARQRVRAGERSVSSGPPVSLRGASADRDRAPEAVGGTTHMVFTPMELMEKLAALVPAPRVNLVRYHGVLAPRSAWRAAVGRCAFSRRSIRLRQRGRFSSTWVSRLEPRRLPGRRRTRNPPRMTCQSTWTSSTPEVLHQAEAGGEPLPFWETCIRSERRGSFRPPSGYANGVNRGWAEFTEDSLPDPGRWDTPDTGRKGA